MRALVGLDEGRAAMLVKWFVASRLRDGDIKSMHAAAAMLALLPQSARRELPADITAALGDPQGGRHALDNSLLVTVSGRASVEAAERDAASALQRPNGEAGDGTVGSCQHRP